MHVPCLKFSPLQISRSKEVEFINKSLLLHKGPVIQTFSLSFPQPDAEDHHVDSWIYFAKTRYVNELNLDFRYNHQGVRIESVDLYRLPHFLHSSTSLTVLSLVRCKIQLQFEFKLHSLKTLSLEEVCFSGGDIDTLTASTPILESLSLANCEKDQAGLFRGRKLKTLKIRGKGPSKYGLTFLIPGYIASLEIARSMPRPVSFVFRAEDLESARFGCNEVNCGQYKEDKGRHVFQILDRVNQAKYLGLCSCYIRALVRNDEESRKCPSFSVTCLEIKTALTKEELPGIGYMLKHSPNIKTLVISIDKIQAKEEICSFNDSEEGDYWILQEPTTTVHLLCNLKDVKIYNFLKNIDVLEIMQMSEPEDILAHLQNDMNFMRFLLKNSKVLERMTISTFKEVNFGHNSENKKLRLLFQLAQELLAFPRASQAAQISFN